LGAVRPQLRPGEVETDNNKRIGCVISGKRLAGPPLRSTIND
jgi:hypothetical protein